MCGSSTVSNCHGMHLCSFTSVVAIPDIDTQETRARFRPPGGSCVRTLLIGTLAATLIGCCPIAPQAISKGCVSKGCIYKTSASAPIESRPASFRPNSAKVKFVTPGKTPGSTSAHPGNQVGLVEKDTPHPITSTPEIAPAETSDPILKKAKITTAAKLENPASAEFGDMKRAIRKDTLGEPIDTVCGHVKVKKTSGEETGEKSFLYLVKEDRAYVDDGNPDSVAATAYRAICVSPDVHGQDLRQQQNRE